MTSKRLLKKYIRAIFGEMLTEVYYYIYSDQIQLTEETKQLIARIVESNSVFIRRAQHVDGASNQKLVKKHYGKLHEDLNKELDSITQVLASLINSAS